MAEQPKHQPGTIGWFDLTVPDAVTVRDFYQRVVGWTSTPCEMGGYQDFTMAPEGGEVTAGICHARGANAAIPPVWLIYITVADLEHSLRECEAHGGKVRAVPTSLGPMGRYALIEDPAGAVSALFEPA
jgi:predicted enzyme related to lactoylglutathione lyase